jgi:hypothetical protein
MISRAILVGFLVAAAGTAAEPAPPSGGNRLIFPVRDFGAVSDGKSESGAAIRAAIAAATEAAKTADRPAEVVLEAGVYRVRSENPRHGYCFRVHEATNLIIRGAGKSTKLLVTDPKLGGFVFGLCRQVTLRDLTIDYDPVPFCQGTIRAVDVAAGHFDLEVEAGHPTPDGENFVKAHEPYGKWGMIMDPATRRIRAGTPDHYMTPRWEHREGRVWRFFTTQEHYRLGLCHMRVGDSYVHLARGYGAAVLAQGCDGVRIVNVTVHASPGLAVGLVANRGEIIVVEGLEVRFAPGTRRLLTTNADGVHCQQNRAGPRIERCYFEGMADDAINIYAPPNALVEIRDPTHWLLSPQCLVLPGDRLQVFDPKTGRVRGEVKAVNVAVEDRRFLIALEKPLKGATAGRDHRDADTLYNLDACGAGFQIRQNRMNGNRRYGCLLRAGGGVVEDNTFEDTTGAGVVLTNEPDWPEGPVPWGITIRGNRFLRGGTCLGYADSAHGAALSVRAVRLGHGLADAEAIRDVVIENNAFCDCKGTAVFVGGATNVLVHGNRIHAAPGAERLRRGPAVLLERSSRVQLTDNTVVDPRPGTSAAVEIAATVAPGESGARIAKLHAKLNAPSSALLDRREATRQPRASSQPSPGERP